MKKIFSFSIFLFYLLFFPGDTHANNSSPQVGTINYLTPVSVGYKTGAGASFTDADLLDTHTASWDWGDGSSPTPGIINEQSGQGFVQSFTPHAYAAPGTYTIILIITDNQGSSGTSTTSVTVNPINISYTRFPIGSLVSSPLHIMVNFSSFETDAGCNYPPNTFAGWDIQIWDQENLLGYSQFYPSTQHSADFYVNIPVGSTAYGIGIFCAINENDDPALDYWQARTINMNGLEGDWNTTPLFTIVPNPIEETNNLVELITTFNLQQGISNSLDAKLNSAIEVLSDINNNNDQAAVNSLYAFINAVEAQRGNKITHEQADTLIAAAQAIIDSLSP